MERVAECHCGQLKAIAKGEPERVYLCHCRSCQRRTGAVMHSGARWPKSEVRIEGLDKIYARMADSGFEIRFHFCPICGSSVFWEGDRGSDYYGIAVGCFADPTFPQPVYSAYEEAMHSWVTWPSRRSTTHTRDRQIFRSLTDDSAEPLASSARATRPEVERRSDQ
jgi:hypothetical protein